MSKKWLKTILASLFLCASLSYLWFGDTFVRQMRRMRMAEAHLPTLTNQIALHPKLREVYFGRGTGAGGCIMALGEVRTGANLRDLKVAVDATKPPVVVLYRVRVLEQNE